MSETYRYRLGIDIGGTFTDFTLVDAQTGTTVGIKVPTVPTAPEQGIANGLDVLRDEHGVDLGEVQYFVNGMTIGLNTLLQRCGSTIALLVTEGFRDVLTLQRMRLPVPYDFHSRLPEPLVPRQLVFGVRERFAADGRELVPLDEGSVLTAVDAAVAQGAHGVAICFLHSYQTPQHEQQAARLVRARHPQLDVCTSSELWPEMREYERACVAVVNLYIRKNVERYFNNLERVLAAKGIGVKPFITQSNGGIMDVRSAAAAPVKTLFSGPAAGVTGAIAQAGRCGSRNLLTFDMGGTSTDISVVSEGQATFSSASELAGIPVVLPTVDIRSIGAGGGSIAWVDPSGLLKIGPESAGSDPGPACYGKSELPTLTDAFLVCGYLNPARFAAGRMALDAARSRRAIGKLADELGKDVETVADEMIQVAASNMYAELSCIMEQQGFDPRELDVVAYGGGGPVMATIVAAEMHARSVLLPRSPGTLCAMGALSADFAYDATCAVNLFLDEADVACLNARLDELLAQAQAWLASQDAPVLEGAERDVSFFADARYAGQAYEIPVPVDDACRGADGCAVLERRFNDEHRRLYGHAEEGARVEVVRLGARIVAHTPALPQSQDVPAASAAESPVAVGTRRIVYAGRRWDAAVFDRTSFAPGQRAVGPCIIEQDDTTTFVLPAWEVSCDVSGILHVKPVAKEA